jgi:predicted Rossmann-fold nucleotide-binding protein
MNLQPNVCVFCGSGPGRNPAYVAGARELGQAIADNGVGLVYGGGSNGLMTMFERSDGFIVLPGGMGTLEELAEMSTWAQLDRHKKPIVLCNIERYWDPLLVLLNHMRAEHFIRPGLELKVDVKETPMEAVERFLERLERKEPEPVPLKPVRQQM